MTPSFELLLVLGILGFYLYDSALLLYFNDLIFIERYGVWSFICPSTHWQILGKTPYVPNPLSPDASLFRVTWSTESPASTDADADATEKLIKALRPLRYLVLGLLVLTIVDLPVVILVLGTGRWFFITLVLIYLVILSILSLVYWRRSALGLSRKDVASLVFESIACPPFAINMVRKITLKHIPTSSPIDFAQHRFAKESFRKLVHAVQARLNEELDSEDDDNQRSAKIKAYSDRLKELVE